VDTRIPAHILFTILLRRATWLLRGVVKTTLLQGRPAMVFMGPRVSLRNAYLCTFGKGVTLETGVIIDALSVDGFHLGDNVSIGAYSHMRASALSNMGSGLRLGKNSSCDAFSFLGAAGPVRIGENVIMGQHVSFHAENHSFADIHVPIRAQGVTRQGIRIDDDCWIGSNVVFLDGCHVGRGSVVGAGSIVRGGFEPYSVIAGVPARVIRSRLTPADKVADDPGGVKIKQAENQQTAKIGVVTVTYNSATVLDDFLRSVQCQTHRNFLLYAVDNASRDTSVKQLQSWADNRLRLLPNSENVGIAEGNNQGTRAALADGCDFILYLNNDIEFGANTFAVLLEELSELDCDMIAPKILYGDGVKLWFAGGGFNVAKGYLTYHEGFGDIDRGQFEQARRVSYSSTCCLLLRKRVFDEIGMMDPKYFVYWDDSDFSFRAWKAGMKLFYTPRARILHKVSTLTGGTTSDFTIRYNARGHVYFMLKHLGFWRCLYYLPALELRLVWKLLSRTIGLHEFEIRQRAMFEGIGVWTSQDAA
jgi:GT2 family glycosyltransferase/acetyltransferase-like isoleucine patch superfamily enzyme